MEKITFTCETITPMFLAGADGRTPELRPPSIKGAMRFWWRALHGHLSLKDLKKRESEIFGGVGEKPKKSSFSIKVHYDELIQNDRIWADLGCEEKISQRSQRRYIDCRSASYKGIAYLFYSMWLNTDSSRIAIAPGFKFEVTLYVSNLDFAEELLKTFMVMSYLGGLGARVRRSAGCFTVNQIFFTPMLQSWYDNSCNEEVKKLCDPENGLKDICDFFCSMTRSRKEEEKNRTYSHLGNAKLCFLKGDKDWQNALESIASPFKCFRDKNKSRIWDTPSFGFPIVHRQTRSTIIGKKANDKSQVIDRRSSPLIITLLKNPRGKGTEALLYPVIVWFKSELLPEDAFLYDKKKTNKKHRNISTKIVEEFISKIEPLAIECCDE